MEWLLIAVVVVVVVLVDFLLQFFVGGVFVYVFVVFLGLVAFLAWCTLFVSMFVLFVLLYFVIGELTQGWSTYVFEIVFDWVLSLQPVWMLVYGLLYVFVVFLSLFVVRQQELFRRVMQAYLMVMIGLYVGFLLYPTVVLRLVEVFGDGFSVWSLWLVYLFDLLYGCFSFFYVVYSFVSALTCYWVYRGVGVGAGFWVAFIGFSTLYMKQYYVVDVIVGALVVCVFYVLFLCRYQCEVVVERDWWWVFLRVLGVIGIFGIMVVGFWVVYWI